MLQILWLIATSITTAVPDAFVARGPGGGGALFSPSFSPDGQELTVACDMSELFRSTDRGFHWDLVPHTQIQGNRASAVRFSGSIRTTLDFTDPTGSDLNQIVQSSDGTHWTKLPTKPTQDGLYNVLVDPNHSGHILSESWGGIYSTLDGGVTWHTVWSPRNPDAGIRLAGAFWDGADVYLGSYDGLLISHDSGKTFALQATPGIAPGQRITSLSGAKSGNTLKLFVATADSGDIYGGLMVEDLHSTTNWGMWTWSNGDAVWKSVLTGVDPDDRLYLVGQASGSLDTLYAAGGKYQTDWPALYGSVDGGAHWTRMLNPTGNANVSPGWAGTGGDRDWSYGGMACGFAVASGNGKQLAYTDYGFIHVSDDGGASWRQAYLDPRDQNPAGASIGPGKAYRSAGLENTTAWSVVWADSLHLFAGFSDVKGIRSTDGGVSWGFGYTGHADNSMYRVVRAANGALYAATSSMHDLYQSTRLADAQLDAAVGHILTSVDMGKTWSVIWTGKGVAWVELDPADPKTMYASVVHSTLGGVLVTHNLDKGAAATWTLLAKPARTEGHPYSLAVLPDGSLVSSWSGRRAPGFTASSGVYRMTKGAAVWQDLSDLGMKYWTKDLVVDPADKTGHTWWVAVFSGWGGAANGLGGLYRTTDAGVHWKRVWDSDRVESVGIPPDDQGEIYATTETQGLWHASDRSAITPTFSQVPSYPFRQPVRVFFNPYDPAEMWVASFGNSLRVGRRDGKPIGSIRPKPLDRAFSVRSENGSVWLEGLSAPTLVALVDPSGNTLYRQLVTPNPLGRFEWKGPPFRGICFLRVGNMTTPLLGLP